MPRPFGREPEGLYRLGLWALGSKAGLSGPKLVVGPYAGARKLKIGGGGPQVDANKSWVDPIVGVRTLWELTPKWRVTALGDIGGFGISGASKFSWQAAGLIGYGACSATTMRAFWRVIGRCSRTTRTATAAARSSGT